MCIEILNYCKPYFIPYFVYYFCIMRFNDIFSNLIVMSRFKTTVIQFCSICIVWSWFCGIFNPEGYAQKHSRINPKSLTSCVHNKSFTRKKLCKRLMIKIYILYSSKQLILDKNYFRLFLIDISRFLFSMPLIFIFPVLYAVQILRNFKTSNNMVISLPC